MKRNPSLLTEREYDLVVIGGGIFGACAAWDAVQRGLSVALVEQGDFGHATSAHHFKMVHGGIRYLQHADLYRVRESSAERSAFLRIAPHLVSPLPIAIPTYGHGMKGKEAMTAALLMYDALTFDRNQGIPDPKRHIPAGRLISRSETLAMFPGLHEEGLTGAAIFHDGQMYNPPRLTLAFIRSAVEAGADVVNYVEAVGLMQDKQRVNGIKVRDRLSGDTFDIRGRVVLNAAGPWAERLLRREMGFDLDEHPMFSRDAYFIVNRRLLDTALAVEGRTKDPDAVLSRGNRHLFIAPWRDKFTLVGVWHVVHEGEPGSFTVTEPELLAFIDEINGAYPGLGVTLDDVSLWSAGLTLFGKNKPGAVDLSYGKRSLIIDHAEEHQVDGLVTLIGVRFTTARGIAEKANNLVFKKLGKNAPASRTAYSAVYGGEVSNFDALVKQANTERPAGLSADLMPALIHNYGAAYQEIFDCINQTPALAAPAGSSCVTQAEVLHAVREEMAQKLSDVVLRRTDLGTGEHPGETALQTCADLMAAELGWDSARVASELDEVRAIFPVFGQQPAVMA